eukprot:NODE_12918_length_1196_cov_4.746492.p1 GENE.NODE_12918_length_1196_cov_4.746492~~NODE_12918_length_1196_cov_4.746492.p1  ORF type:complete len:389 (-),score=62.51 NODE_12918_length_1196_cov_4.746492:30-1097(-)
MLLPLVLVTGASGFIGSHIVQQLLSSGFRVRGSVSSEPASARFAFLQELDVEGHLELVQANLVTTSEDGWRAVAEGATYCIHVASPVLARRPVNETAELIVPAVRGTEVVLRACAGAGARRVVLTSSENAVVGKKLKQEPYTEEDWTDLSLSTLASYQRSKTMAEQAAWRLMSEFSGTTDLAVIIPGVVVGPLLSTHFPSSVKIVHQAFSPLHLPAAPPFHFHIVDVRDVAAAHVAALTAPAARNERIIVSGDVLTMKEILAVLRTEFTPRGYWISPFSLPYAMTYLASFFSPSIRVALDFSVEKLYHLNTSKCAAVLNVTARPVRESVVETAYSLIKHGFLSPLPRGALSAGEL